MHDIQSASCVAAALWSEYSAPFLTASDKVLFHLVSDRVFTKERGRTWQNFLITSAEKNARHFVKQRELAFNHTMNGEGPNASCSLMLLGKKVRHRVSFRHYSSMGRTECAWRVDLRRTREKIKKYSSFVCNV